MPEMTSALPSAYLDLLDDEDDARRLVAADDLSQRGDPLGEFIMVQCELARLPSYACGRRLLLERRQESLLNRHRARWLGDLPLTDAEKNACGFRRGLPDSARLSVERFIALAAELTRFRELTLNEPGALGHVDPPTLAGVERLKLYFDEQRFTIGGLEHLFRDGSAARLRALDIAARVPAGAATALAATAGLQALRELDLPRLTDEDLSGLCASRGIPTLTSLSLTGLELTEPVATALAHASWKLSKLSIGGTSPTSEGSHRMRSKAWELLAQAPWTHTVSSLALSRTFIGAASFAKMQLPALETLRASYSVDDVVLARLSEAPWISQLVHLDISNNRVTEVGLSALGRARLDNLTALTLRTIDLGDDRRGANLLVDAELPKLAVLDLHGCNLGDADVERLCRAPWLSHLVEVDLSRNHITEKGLARLARAPLASLTDLVLEKNYVLGPSAVDGFREAARLPFLRIHY